VTADNEYMAKYMAARRASRRATLIKQLGGHCVRCATTEDLQFDHIVPGSQAFRISGKGLDKPWSVIQAEVVKCQLLCDPCHRAKSKECGETGGGWNKIDGPDGFRHGTESGYMRGGCRCDDCSQARHDARIARGELKGSRGRYKTRSHNVGVCIPPRQGG
jgi:hypothetical protein